MNDKQFLKFCINRYKKITNKEDKKYIKKAIRRYFSWKEYKQFLRNIKIRWTKSMDLRTGKINSR